MAEQIGRIKKIFCTAVNDSSPACRIVFFGFIKLGGKMSMKIRKLISHRIAELVKSDNLPYLLSNVPALLELRKTEKAPELHLPVIKTRNLLEKNGATLIKQIVETKYDDRLIKDVSVVQETTKSSRAPTIIFKLNTDNFIKEALNEVQNIDQLCFGERQKIIVEYSSPNIAKPFHVGHLRSTIIGNFIANLYKFLGNDVVKMNYLGDWGTQFGMLQVGVEMTGITEEEIKQNPIQKLYEAYVSANRAAESNSEIAEKARQVFTQLEMHESSDIKKKWSRFRNYTIDELKCIYDRLGVHFDEYAWESQYSQKEIQNIIHLLSSKNLLLTENDGKKVVQVDDRKVPVIKSDGTTLYLARDIAAILDRFERYKFDKIFYVVDNAQTDHFHACFHIANKLEQNLQAKAAHIKFGRIKGMSTRTGSAVFLKDVLDEARDIMLQKQLQSPTTKLDMKNFDSTTADVLGVSAVIVNDLKQRRQRDYDYVLERALQVNGDTGIKLQYTHCRLCSISDKVQVADIKEFDPNLLVEPEARDLIMEITRFPESIFKARQEHEACALVNYLFSLSNVTSRALKRLNVKNEKSSEIQAQRMGLFNASRIILETGIKILGLKPLEKM